MKTYRNNQVTFILATVLGALTSGICSARVPGNHRPGAVRINVRGQLNQTVDLSGLAVNTSFAEAIEILSKSTTPRLNIVVLWRGIRDYSLVDRESPIMMDGVSDITAKTGLELLLRAMSSGPDKFGYVVRGNTVVVGMKSLMPARMYTRVYNVSDLAAAPSFAPAPGFAGPGIFGLGNFIGMGFPGGNRGMRPGSYGTGYNSYGRGYNRQRRGYGSNRSGYSTNRTRNRSGASGRRSYRGGEIAEVVKNTIAPESWR